MKISPVVLIQDIVTSDVGAWLSNATLIYIGVAAKDLCIDKARTALDIFCFAVFLQTQFISMAVLESLAGGILV